MTKGSDWRALEVLISPDPNLPSLAYQAHENSPIVIPWTRDNIALGVGLTRPITSQTNIARDALRPSPFVPAAKVVFEMADNSNLFLQSSSAYAATSYEHMNLNGSLSVGGSFIGASGKAEFNKAVYNNRDFTKVSLQASLRVGRIAEASIPRLSSHALYLLRTSPAAFHAEYGDYFLYSATIGADTSTFLSTSSSFDLKSEMHDIQGEASVLGISTSVSEHKNTHSTASAYDITYIGFDSLSDYRGTTYATDEESYNALRTEARDNVAAGIAIEKRVQDGLQACAIVSGASLSAQEYAKVCESGLVVEGTFIPYVGLREYVACVAASARSLAYTRVERIL